jgi:choline kinase
MQAIILAAGRGSRLGAAGNGLPKALLSIDGECLLNRQRMLLSTAFTEISVVTVVVGFRASEVQAAGGPELRYVLNDSFNTTNASASLYLALRQDDQDAVLLNGDVFCDLEALRQARCMSDGAVCEFKPAVDSEAVQVLLDENGRVGRIGKDIGGCAEAIGIYRLSRSFSHRYLADYTDRDTNRYFVDVFNSMISTHGLQFEAISLGAGRAIEIDTEADLVRAKMLAAELRAVA